MSLVENVSLKCFFLSSFKLLLLSPSPVWLRDEKDKPALCFVSVGLLSSFAPVSQQEYAGNHRKEYNHVLFYTKLQCRRMILNKF